MFIHMDWDGHVAYRNARRAPTGVLKYVSNNNSTTQNFSEFIIYMIDVFSIFLLITLMHICNFSVFSSPAFIVCCYVS